MVMACCRRYNQYIEKDGTIDPEFLVKEFGASAVVIKEEIEDKQFVEMAKKYNQPIPTNTFVLVNGVKNELCVCDCHVKGMCVMH